MTLALRHLPLALALLPVASLAAEEPAPAGSPTQDVQCAAWAAYVISASDDPDVKTAVGYAMTYFIGIYEGKTGKKFTEAMLGEGQKVETDEAFRLAVSEICLPRMQDIGDRMANYG